MLKLQNTMDKSFFKINKDVTNALKNNKPIVALESTLISHGLPYPENLKVAKLSIEAVKKSGSVPATIAIINGKIKVGLNDKDLKLLAKSKNVYKITKNNLFIAINKKLNGATTVGSTINIASKVGIKFFATGGIGGVHLDSEKTFDISSDLYELSKNKMFIICSGAKSILDLDKTYEKLESFGIPRIGYKTEFMPGFWYYQTNNKVDYNFKKIPELTNYLKTYEKFKNDISVLIFNAISKEKTIQKNKINKWIKVSLKKAKKLSIDGKELTPFLIKEINVLSKNKTLDTNIELIIDNAKLAGKIANSFFS